MTFLALLSNFTFSNSFLYFLSCKINLTDLLVILILIAPHANVTDNRKTLSISVEAGAPHEREEEKGSVGVVTPT